MQMTRKQDTAMLPYSVIWCSIISGKKRSSHLSANHTEGVVISAGENFGSFMKQTLEFWMKKTG